MKKLCTLLLLLFVSIQSIYSQIKTVDIIHNIGKSEKELNAFFAKNQILPTIFYDKTDDTKKGVFINTDIGFLISNGYVISAFCDLDENITLESDIRKRPFFGNGDYIYYYYGYLNNKYVYMTYTKKDKKLKITFIADTFKQH